jgi:hypothetical protein
VGRVVGGVEMVLGVSFFTFLTAGVTSTVIRRASARAQEDDRSNAERDTKAILGALAETREAISDLDARLARIETDPASG